MPLIRSVEVCNIALARLGEERINALDEAHPSARALALQYDTVLESLVARWDWSFARRTAVPAFLGSGEAESGGRFLYKYAAPVGMVKPYAVMPEAAAGKPAPCEAPYLFAGGAIFTDVTSPWLRYGAADIDPMLWTAAFKEAFAMALAAAVAMPVTRDDSLRERMEMRAERAFHAAAADDGNSSPLSYLPEGGAIEYARHAGL